MGKVIILGAGASAGYENSEVKLRSPIARNFLQISKKLIDSQKIPERFGELWDFIEKYYHIDREKIDSCEIDIEELLTFLDIDNKHKKIREKLIQIIYLTLDKVLYGEPCPYHRRLISQLDHDDAIITFNWDLLVDNLISLENNCPPDYATTFDKTFIGRWVDYNPETNRPKLLKLHGSLNWMYCKKCKKSYNYVLQGKVTTDMVLNPDAKWLKCPDCQNHQLEPIIIPPTINKHYKKWEIIKQIWKEAKNCLIKADEITIIGYSLPLTDFRAKWLFMEAVAEHKQPLKKLTIVDKYPDGLFEKYKKLFKVNNDNFEGIVGEIKEIWGHPYRF